MARDEPVRDETASETDEHGTAAGQGIDRRSYLKLASAAAVTVGAGAGLPSVTGAVDNGEVIEIDYDKYSAPSEIYNVNDNRSGISPEFVSSPTKINEKALRTEFSSDSKTANLEYRFEEHGYDMPTEIYTRFYVYPNGIRLSQYDTMRIFWLPLTNGSGSSGGGEPDGTNGWSNAIGFSDRNGSPSGQSPPGYNFFSYTYHMDESGDFEMTDVPVWMDQWNEIEGYVRSNTYSNGAANADGVMRYWVNGELAYERTNFRFTTSDDNLIEGVGPLGYVIGDDQSGNALIYDGHEIHIGGVSDGSNTTDSTEGTTSTLAVATDGASSVAETNATLNGSLTDLGGASSVDVYFEWGPSSESLTNTTDAQTLSSTGSFSQSLSGLSSGTDYEYRAIADASDGDADTGGTVTFTTDSGSDSPIVDSYTVVEAGSPNPHAEITADWSVSDPDGDLDSVFVEVIDSTGAVADGSRTDISGSGASGVDSFKLKHVGRATYNVRLTVTDSSTNSVSQTKTVSSDGRR